jgi:hypothetical protein
MLCQIKQLPNLFRQQLKEYKYGFAQWIFHYKLNTKCLLHHWFEALFIKTLLIKNFEGFSIKYLLLKQKYYFLNFRFCRANPPHEPSCFPTAAAWSLWWWPDPRWCSEPSAEPQIGTKRDTVKFQGLLTLEKTKRTIQGFFNFFSCIIFRFDSTS